MSSLDEGSDYLAQSTTWHGFVSQKPFVESSWWRSEDSSMFFFTG